MKIGPVEIHWHRGTSTLRESVLEHMKADPEVRMIAAKMTRSEVKNYLAALAEQAEYPFDSPAGFLRAIRLNLTNFGSTTNLDGDGDDPYDQDDAPFILGETTLPSGHTTTCSCDPALKYPTPTLASASSSTETAEASPTSDASDQGPDEDLRDFCNAVPAIPEGATWPVCNLLEHEDDRHESADYYWIDGSPAVLKSPVLP
jgi:hypothetical protein